MTQWLAGLIDFASNMPCRAMEFNQIFCAVIQDTIKKTIYHLFPMDTSMYITILRDSVDQFEWLKRNPDLTGKRKISTVLDKSKSAARFPTKNST